MLSSGLRDQVYRRFRLAAIRDTWFTSRAIASAIGVVLTFGVMGVWHGTARHYVAYGLYHAARLIRLEACRHHPRSAADADGRNLPRVGALLITGHAAAFGFQIFSGRIF